MTEKSTHKGKKSSGAFHTMGLPASLLQAIRKLNYKQPTPIQRKAIPPLLAGLDVVGMARTGSGKTAAFAIPMIVRLREHEAVVGVRAVVVSPTRELAMQIGKTVTCLCKGTDLRVGQIFGGESLEAQFAVLAQNPDILVVTPGRLLHLVQAESKLGLARVQVVVFDEADRLFEMGFAEQLRDLLQHLPANRQTCLFSATLPASLVDFAQAGLRSDAQFIRLDSELKVSPDLTCRFFRTRSDSRVASLMHILNTFIYNNNNSSITSSSSSTNSKKKVLTIIFTATRHHVEYLHQLLVSCGYEAVGVYGAMDQEARTEALSSFRLHKTPILVTTDLAARGLDIPMLDFVINVDMPATGKLFIHRVGRVARAGRTGTAFSLCTTDELPYYVDLCKHLSLPVESSLESLDGDNVDILAAQLDTLHSTLPTLASLHKVMTNAIKHYVASRPSASPDAYTVAKTLPSMPGCDLIFSAIHNYKPNRKNVHLNSSVTAGKSSSRKRERDTMTTTDNEYYMSYKPKNDTAADEKLYSLHSQLANAADRHTAEPDISMKRHKQQSATSKYKDGGAQYDKWRKRTHVSLPRVGEQELDEKTRSALSRSKRRW